MDSLKSDDFADQSNLKANYLYMLNRDGFVHIPSLISATELETLRCAASQTTYLARSGNWPLVRSLPKQFPPWDFAPGSRPAANGIWGVQALMHPSLPTAKAFIPSYFNFKIIDVVKELLLCEDDDLVMELYNMLVRPDEHFQLRWHRDDVPASASPQEELRRLGQPPYHAQWNLALYDDESLVVVPGSHIRARTEEERNAGVYQKLSGELSVKMKAGDVVFYNNNILHRGVYDPEIERMTLHGSMGHRAGGALRARNVLQHGLRDWVRHIDLDVLAIGERQRAKGMLERLIQLGDVSGDVGYSLESW